jgi:hypothetical protein
MAAIQLGWQRGRRSAAEQAEADEPSAGPSEVTGTADDSSADDTATAVISDPAGQPESAHDTESASDGEPADDTESAGDTDRPGDTEPASGEFRTTPSPKQGRRRGPRRN